MKRRYGTHIVVMLAMGLSHGCVTTRDQHRRDIARVGNEIRNYDQRILQVEARVNDLHDGQQAMLAELEALRRSQTENDGRIDRIEKAVLSMPDMRDRIRSELADELSGKISTLVGANAGGRTEHGRQHVVRQGETLSEIAAAYGSTVDAVAKANRLANPNAIRVGQTIFIPE